MTCAHYWNVDNVSTEDRLRRKKNLTVVLSLVVLCSSLLASTFSSFKQCLKKNPTKKPEGNENRTALDSNTNLSKSIAYIDLVSENRLLTTLILVIEPGLRILIPVGDQNYEITFVSLNQNTMCRLRESKQPGTPNWNTSSNVVLCVLTVPQ